LAALLEAGVVSRVDVADERFYTIDQDRVGGRPRASISA
jgi:hypothetical protein